MVQAKWGDMRWEITDKVFKTLSTISTSQSVKKQTNNDNAGSSATSTQGLELQTVPLVYNVLRGLGVDPYEEFQKWQSRLTKVNALYLSTKRFGSLHMQLDSAGIGAIELDNAGNILSAEISLNFTESAEEASESKAGANSTTGLTSGKSIRPSTADKAKLKFKEIRLEPPTDKPKPILTIIPVTNNTQYPTMPGFEPNQYSDAPIFQGPFN